MTHYKTLLDPGIFIIAADFPVEKTVKISRVAREKMPERKGEESQNGAMLYFQAGGKELARKYKLPKSVMYGLSLVFGVEIEEWVGKDVTLFAAKCKSFGDIEECVRIRFPADIEARIFKWVKKRKAPAGAYMIREESGAAPSDEPGQEAMA